VKWKLAWEIKSARPLGFCLLCLAASACSSHVSRGVWYAVGVNNTDMCSGVVRGWRPGGGDIFCTLHTGCEAHPASYTLATGSFPGVKRPGRGVDHPPPSSAEVTERVELYLYSPTGLMCPVLG
jgi:hypothetical protein